MLQMDETARRYLESLMRMRQWWNQKSSSVVLFQGEAAVLGLLQKDADGGGDGMAPSDISRTMGVTRATVTSALNALEKKEYIVRSAQAGDRRRVLVRLTPAGQERIRNQTDWFIAGVSYVMEQMGTDRFEEMMDLLDEAGEHIQNFGRAHGNPRCE